MYHFKTGPVYQANSTATADIVINQGGTDSGKTYSLIQLLFTIATTEKAPKEDPIITIVGESIPNLKKGAYRIANEIISTNPGLSYYIKKINETDRILYFSTGWVMEFVSHVNEQSAKQGKRQYAFFNEANGIPYLIFWQIAKRTRRRVFIDYNPTEPFWVHDNLIGTDKYTNDLSATVQLIISDHRHNPFLSEQDHFRTENIKDKDLWNVYARGKTGNLTGLVYPRWTRIPDDHFPRDADFFGGLDFGYTNDPTAGVKIAAVGRSIFLHELCYSPGISAELTKQIFFANGFTENTDLYCENDPDQVKELREAGLYALLARKGPGSIKGGIKKINEFNVFYTASSVNLHEERIRYMYETDKITGKSLNTPKGGFDHLLDAARMGVYTRFHQHGEI